MNGAVLPYQPIGDFAGLRHAPVPAERLRSLRAAAQGWRERFLDEPELLYYRSVDLIRVPYPAWYAFTGVYAQAVLKPPMVHLLNRLFVVQYLDFAGQRRTLLFSPSDHAANRETPFFKRLGERVPASLQPLLAPVLRSVPEALAECGIRPEQVDFISYDHLHTQDLRNWLGSQGQPGLFPNARLLVHREEWAAVAGLLPCQADWYCPHGVSGVADGRVVVFDGDIQLGRGLALIHTPGHTAGNHSLVCRVADGIRVSSENGVAADAYAPLLSRNNAIRRYAQATGAEVILNGNTLEGSTDQYLSMVVEKTIAGPAAGGEFPNCVPSSEATPFWLFPGYRASHLFGQAQFGTVA